MADAERGLIPDENLGPKGDERDAQVSGPMPGVTVVNHAQAHQMQEADIVGKHKGYPMSLRFWEQGTDPSAKPSKPQE